MKPLTVGIKVILDHIRVNGYTDLRGNARRYLPSFTLEMK
jgi:hypothetical protein